MFLNDYIQEKVYVYQTPYFLNFCFPSHVIKLKKTLYSLKQSPWAWYGYLCKFLLERNFQRGKVDIKLSLRKLSMPFYLCKHMLVILFSMILTSHYAWIFWYDAMWIQNFYNGGALVYSWIKDISIIGSHLHQSS